MPEDLPTSKKSLKQLEKEKSISERFANVGKIVQKYKKCDRLPKYCRNFVI